MSSWRSLVTSCLFYHCVSCKTAKTIYARQVAPAEPVVRIRSPIADLFTAPKRKTISAIFVGARDVLVKQFAEWKSGSVRRRFRWC
ncbi:hypothetical protein Y032_0325g2553 [Ancylostoma ceylanicum]|nr:hypothetical protein Y032_0325g2553 [Ancylostoma ceylanicum]